MQPLCNYTGSKVITYIFLTPSGTRDRLILYILSFDRLDEY